MSRELLEDRLQSFLEPILGSLPEGHGLKIAAMIKHEIQHRPLVTWFNAVTGYDYQNTITVDVDDERAPGKKRKQTFHAPSPVFSEWRILERSPVDQDKTIWAMVQCDDAIVIFTVVKVVTPSDKDHEAEEGYAFHREVVKNWKQLAGPIDADALLHTFEKFMVEAEPPPACARCGAFCGDCAEEIGKAHANGAAAQGA